MIKKIGKITLYVNNQERAKRFWVEKIGFVVKFEKEMGPDIKWIEVGPSEGEFATFILYDKNIMKMQNSNANVEHPSIILSTDNLEVTYKEMKEKGVNVGDIMTMPYGSMFKFKDLDGNDFLVREDRYN